MPVTISICHSDLLAEVASYITRLHEHGMHNCPAHGGFCFNLCLVASYALLKMRSCDNSKRSCFQTFSSENNSFWSYVPQLPISNGVAM